MTPLLAAWVRPAASEQDRSPAAALYVKEQALARWKYDTVLCLGKSFCYFLRFSRPFFRGVQNNAKGKRREGAKESSELFASLRPMPLAFRPIRSGAGEAGDVKETGTNRRNGPTPATQPEIPTSEDRPLTLTLSCFNPLHTIACHTRKPLIMNLLYRFMPVFPLSQRAEVPTPKVAQKVAQTKNRPKNNPRNNKKLI
ncbi:MAG: hypothetical protein ABSH38_19395 [Verrucomicrobiota bacterium]|jgi:hypothetical protein